MEEPDAYSGVFWEMKESPEALQLGAFGRGNFSGGSGIQEEGKNFLWRFEGNRAQALN